MNKTRKCVQCEGSIPAERRSIAKFCGKKCKWKAERLRHKDKKTADHKAWKARNPERVRELRRASAKRCPETPRHKEWLIENAQRMRDHRRKWKKANPGIVAADTRSRQLKKVKATPNWLSAEQKNKIVDIYKRAAEITKQTGLPHDVDHIIPIRGKAVCGLHVPWNLQILTRTENARKSNRVAA